MYTHDTDETGDDPGQDRAAIALLPTAERDYIIPAQDTKGHHIRLYCRAMPAVGRMAADVHASHKYPFRTIGDLIRWCVVTGTKRLASGAGIESVTAQADIMIRALQDEEFQLQFLDFFNYLKRVVDHFVEAGTPGEARRVIATARGQIEQMPHSYWRNRYREELLKRYGQLLDNPGGERGTWDPDTAPGSDAQQMSA